MSKYTKSWINVLSATKEFHEELIRSGDINEDEVRLRFARGDRKRIAQELKESGLSNRKIAEVLDVDHRTIDRDLGGENSPLNGENSPVSRLEKRKDYEQQIEDGCTVEDLASLAASGKKFSVVYADPPWTFKVYSGKGKGRSAERHYDTMELDEIAALPIKELAADDCALFLWSVWPEIPGAMRIIKAWGFEYKTCGFLYVKQNKSGDGIFTGMGYWTRANSEPCLFATRGSPKRQAMDVHQVVLAPVGEHSRKPDEVQLRIERLLSGPYLELFGRRASPGWTVWGNEISRNLFQQDIPELSRVE